MPSEKRRRTRRWKARSTSRGPGTREFADHGYLIDFGSEREQNLAARHCAA
jgi:hypothetical protein